ncbi:hypothetical protein SRABI118_03848 [Massilia sp. Bi118]|uniref:hypothetical protein n=1 Tax=Massilia sp. Bi118 TaxID=2822346 RepID=UPI001D644E15|nr:hypothetical protein [Massilia sp. Bi118]CAH0283437.1 hypothetical protein SRABI118_03848 [Massilia sp. Bi118]
MKIQYPLARAAACLLLAVSSVHVHAQQAADPQASVPATSYQSPLAKPAEAAPASTPDASWVKSNQTVAATNSMALTMKPMASQAADPHAGHAMHDHAAMQGMNMDKKDSPAMCAPGGDKDKGMQCMSSDKSGQDKMSCCGAGCESCCCKDKMKKAKEAP